MVSNNMTHSFSDVYGLLKYGQCGQQGTGKYTLSVNISGSQV